MIIASRYWKAKAILVTEFHSLQWKEYKSTWKLLKTLSFEVFVGYKIKLYPIAMFSFSMQVRWYLLFVFLSQIVLTLLIVYECI